MKILVRVIITLGTIVAVLVALASMLSLGGGVNIGDYVRLIGITQPLATPVSSTGDQGAPGEIVDSSTVAFVWRGDQILYLNNPITEERFSELLAQAKAKSAPVQVLKRSDVTVANADRWRLLLEDAQVQYEVTTTE